MPVKTRSKKTRTKKQAEPLWGPKPEKPLWRHPDESSEKQARIPDAPRKQSQARQLVSSLLDEFPEAATNTLATRAYHQNHGFWPTFNACALMFRRMRGQQGREHRGATTDKTHFREPGKCRGFEPIPEIPQGLKHLGEWGPVEVDVPGPWLILSDVHVPYHDKAAVDYAIKRAVERRVVGVLLNGDIADCHAVSRWETDWRKRNFPGEIDKLRIFFAAIRGNFPKARIIWKFGNHEERYQNYQWTKSPQTLGVADFEMENFCHAPNYGIEVVKDKRPICLGKLWTIHGHEYKTPFGISTNPSQWLFRKAHECCLAGHFHRNSFHSENSMSGRLISCWTTGHLCDEHPDYNPLNNNVQGAVIADISKDGAFEVDNFRIRNGKLWR